MDAGILAFLLLVTAPGCLVSFGLRCQGLEWRHRLLLGMALSPCVAAVQMVVLKAAGVEFAVAARWVLVFDVLALGLVLRRTRLASLEAEEWWGLLGTGLVLSAMAAALVISWRLVPSFPLFSWHAMHHSDICYALTRAGVVPDDPNMAGYAVGYPFLTHYFWALAAWFLAVPPNVAYLVTTLLGLALSAFLSYEAARALGCRPASALAAVAFVFAGNDLIGLASAVAGFWSRPLGDYRALAFLQKFFDMNVMPFVLPLVSALFLLGGALLRQPRGRSWDVLFAAVLVGTGLLYPILAPAVFLAGAVIVAASARAPGTSRWPFVHRVVWLGVAALTVAVVWGILLSGREGPSITPLSAAAMGAKATGVAVAFGPIVLFAVAATWRRRERLPAALVLTAAAGAVVAAAYVLASFYASNEYKWIFVAGIAFALLAGRALECANPSWRAVLSLVVLLTAISATLNVVRFRRMVAWHTVAFPIPDVDWEGFWLRLATPESEAAWLAVLADGTPPDTVLVAPPSRLPLYGFARRAEYVALDPHPGHLGRTGYGHPMSVGIPGVHGLPSGEYQRRRREVEGLYQNQHGDQYPQLLTSLQSLGRPLAIRFEDPSHAFLDWLRVQQIGKPLLLRSDGALWFIPAAAVAEGRVGDRIARDPSAP